MKRKRLLAALVLVAIALAADPPRAGDAGRLQAVKYDELTDAIRKLKGKVVVVDFWADYCPPCKREFPRLVGLHARYAAAGLAAVSVSLDDPAEAGTTSKVQKFLDARHAAFANYVLDERPAVWQAKLKVDGPPAVYVFNRNGELEQKFADEVDYNKVESLVADLLKK
jgi:thiol-disulfide isomerase/thioredoxin